MPRELPPSPAAALVRAIARIALKGFFREVEVVGAERIPLDRPLVFVANHVNGLIDPLLLFGPLPVTPRFLAKSTLFKVPVVGSVFKMAGAIPVYRQQDPGSDTSRNAETFARCHETLAAGGSIGLFPEGISHSDPSLKPLKTGAARIVLEAEQRFPGLGARIVPVGLLFDAKEAFRSRALVQVGEPIDPSSEIRSYAADPAAAVRTLTGRIDAALKDVTLNYDTWEDARLLARAADLYRRRAPELPGQGKFSESVIFRRGFLEATRDLRQTHPERMAALAQAVREYDRLLHTFRLRDDQVGAAYRTPPVVRFVIRSLLLMLVHLPLAAVGTLLTWPIYRLIGFVIQRIPKGPDQVASSKVVAGFIGLPLTWIAEGILLGRWLGPWTGALLALTAPFTTYSALLFNSRRVLFWRESRAYLLLRTQKRLAAELKARREAVLREVEELAHLWATQM